MSTEPEPIQLDLLRKQAEFYQCDRAWAGARGGVGSGKTFGMCLWLLDRMDKYPQASTYVAGADFEQLRRGLFTTLRGMLDQTLGWEPERDYQYRDSQSPMLTITKTGARLRSVTAEQAERIRSVEIQTLACEEPQTWHNGEQVFRTLVGRLRQSQQTTRLYPKMQARGRMTFNPPSVGSWLYDLVERSWPKMGYPCWQFSLRDNVLMADLEGYIKQIEGQYPRELWPVEIDGEWRTVGGYFFTEADIASAIDDELGFDSLPDDEGREKQVLVLSHDEKQWVQKYPSHRYIHGWDLADKSDWTVGTTWDASVDPITLVEFERFNKTGWAHVFSRIRQRHSKYGNSKTIVDATGLGQIAVDELSDIGVVGFTFTKQSKDKALGDVQLMLSARELRVPRIRVWLDEMRWYERDDKDLITDCVMSTAVAATGLKRRSDVFVAFA